MTNLIDTAIVHLESWSPESPEYQRLADGFVAFCYDVRTETLAALTDGEDAQLVDDLVYSWQQNGEDGIRTADKTTLLEAMREVVHYNRRNFINALRESLVDD